MSNYFSNFPNVNYDLGKDGNTQNVVDIMRRFVIQAKLDDRTAIYYNYDIQEHDSAWSIADKYYGSPDYDWVVLLVNNIFEPDHEWPMKYQNFINFIKAKYTTLAAAKAQVHHYERILRTEAYDSMGNWLPEINVEVDLETYNGLGTTLRRVVYAFDYEEELNEARRSIKIMDKQHLGELLKEAESILK